MANIKKRNHYITRQFLEGFCDCNGRVWTYTKENPSNPFANKPTETAVFNRLYHLQKGENITAVEDYFSDSVETPASIVLKKLLNKDFPDKTEKEKLALFFGLLMVRTPSYIEHVNNQCTQYLKSMAHTSASNKEYFYTSFKNIYPDINENEIEETRQIMLKNGFSYEINRDLLLKKMLDLGSIIASHIVTMKWALIETNSDYPFIVSDNFMHIYHPTINDGFYTLGLGIPDIRVHIPISQKLSLMLVNNEKFIEGMIFDIENPPVIHNNPIDLKALIELLNKNIFIKCQKYVFANSDSENLKECFSNLIIQAKEIEDNTK